MSARNMAKRTAAGTLALAVCLGGGALALAGAAQADANFKFDSRIAGDDRYETAIAASKAAFPTDGKTENVVLVNGFATVDGLTASYLAGVANAPILYVSDKGADAKTQAEIKRLGVKNVWLVGGTTVIPQSVEDAMKVDYKVTRINGSDRYETAKMIAAKGAELSGKKPSKVLVASGTSFADALAVSPVAYAKGYAIALTEKDKTSDYTKDELKAIGADTKILVGGTAVVSDSVAKDLGVTKRVAGDDRAITANLVSDWAKSDEGFTKTQAALVGGTNGNGADSLVASSVLGKSMTTLHFAGWDATYVYLKDHAAELTGKGVVFGGKAAVNDDQVSKAQAAAQFVAAVGSLTVSSDDSTVALQGSRTYTISGLTAGKTYNIALVSSDQVTGGAFALATSGATGNRYASLTASASANVVIDRINNVGVTGGVSKEITATSSSVTFRVTSPTGGVGVTTVPVVYTKTDGTNLSVNLAGAPTSQAVGVGGKTVFKAVVTPPSETAANTTQAAANVDALYGSTGFTVAGTTTQFVMGDGDIYKYGSATVTKAQFQSILGVGDNVTVGYKATADDGKSTFTIVTDALGNAVAPSVGVVGSKATVTYTPLAGTTPNGTVIELSRAQVVGGVTGSYTVVKTGTVANLDQQVFSESLPDGTYNYKLTYKNASFSAATSTPAVSTPDTVISTSGVGTPTLKRLYLSSNASDVNNLSKDDVFKAVVSSPLTQPVNGATLVFGSGANTLTLTGAAATATAAGSAVFTVNTSAEVVDGVSQPAGTVLTVKLLAAPVTAGTQTAAFGSTLALQSSTGIAGAGGSLAAPTAANGLLQDVAS